MTTLKDLQEVESLSWQHEEGADLRFLGEENQLFWGHYFKSPFSLQGKNSIEIPAQAPLGKSSQNTLLIPSTLGQFEVFIGVKVV